MCEKPPEIFPELFAPFSQELKEMGNAIRTEILAALPGADENIYGGKKWEMSSIL